MLPRLRRTAADRSVGTMHRSMKSGPGRCRSSLTMPFDVWFSRPSASSPSRAWRSTIAPSAGCGAPAGAPAGPARDPSVPRRARGDRGQPAQGTRASAARSNACSMAFRALARARAGTTASATTSVRLCVLPPARKKRRRTCPVTTTSAPASGSGSTAAGQATGTVTRPLSSSVQISSRVRREPSDSSRTSGARLERPPQHNHVHLVPLRADQPSVSPAPRPTSAQPDGPPA